MRFAHADAIGSVARGGLGKNPDVLTVMGEHGELALCVPMQPGNLLSPCYGDQWWGKPWFFTGSPFGPEIVGMAWLRSADAIERGEWREG